MIGRAATRLLRARLKSFPAVGLVGPRQCGKTTLARSLPGEYFDLEQEADRLRLDLAWEDLMAGRRLVVLDEAQAWPVVFARLRGAIDADRGRSGRFLLLGSVSPHLMRAVSESLAGRMALLELTPMLLEELPRARADLLWLRGGFPDGGARGRSTYPVWQRSYLRLLAERDLPLWGLPASPIQTDRLLRMLAAMQGGLWNASDIGRSLGLSYHTVNSWLAFLDGAFLIRRLAPWHGNLGKRLVKSPKVYLRDSGLLHALLGAESMDDLRAKPWVGASFEGWVIEQVIGHLMAWGRDPQAHFFRTADGQEIDLVLDLEGTRWAVEVKLASSAGPSDLDRLERLADLIEAPMRCIVTRTTVPLRSGRRVVTNLGGLLDLLRASGGRRRSVAG